MEIFATRLIIMKRINLFLRELTGVDSDCVLVEIPEAPKKMRNDLFIWQDVCNFIAECSKVSINDSKNAIIYRGKYIKRMILDAWDGIVNAKYNKVQDSYFSWGDIPANNLAITLSGETHRLFIDLNHWDCIPKYWYWHAPKAKLVKEEDYSVISLLMNLVNFTERDNNFKLALTKAMHDYGAKHTSDYGFILWSLGQINALDNDCISVIIRFFWLSQFF